MPVVCAVVLGHVNSITLLPQLLLVVLLCSLPVNWCVGICLRILTLSNSCLLSFVFEYQLNFPFISISSYPFVLSIPSRPCVGICLWILTRFYVCLSSILCLQILTLFSFYFSFFSSSCAIRCHSSVCCHSSSVTHAVQLPSFLSSVVHFLTLTPLDFNQFLLILLFHLLPVISVLVFVFGSLLGSFPVFPPSFVSILIQFLLFFLLYLLPVISVLVLVFGSSRGSVPASPSVSSCILPLVFDLSRRRRLVSGQG